GKSFFSAHEVSTCKISGCLSYRILDSGPDGTQTTLTTGGTYGHVWYYWPYPIIGAKRFRLWWWKW
ncbi:hypothetical protein B9P90_22725, partial [Citrobacter freundii]